MGGWKRECEFAGRLDTDSGGKITMNGGKANLNDELNFPDTSGRQDIHTYLNGVS